MTFKKHIKIPLTILMLLSSLNVFAQEEDYTLLMQHYGVLCGDAIYLYNDSTFLFNTGCEQHVSVSCGSWEMRDDTIFIEEERTKQNVYSILKERDLSNDTTITLLVLDKNDQPVHGLMAVGFPNEIHHSLFQSLYSGVDVRFSDIQREFFGAGESNKNGYIEFPVEYTDKIKLLSLVLFDEDFVIDVNGFTRITVKINTNPKIFHYPLYFTKWVEEYPNKIVPEDGRTYYLKVKKEQ